MDLHDERFGNTARTIDVGSRSWTEVFHVSHNPTAQIRLAQRKAAGPAKILDHPLRAKLAPDVKLDLAAIPSLVAKCGGRAWSKPYKGKSWPVDLFRADGRVDGVRLLPGEFRQLEDTISVLLGR